MVDELDVGYRLEDGIHHKFPMYSLKKLYEGEDNDKIHAFQEKADYVVTPKLDGSAISLVYIQGMLTCAITRGDGKKGRNVTKHVRHLVPEVISSLSIVQICGEIIAPSTIKNARNYASGALNLIDSSEVKSRDLYFVAYSLEGTNYPTYVESMNYLQMQGFKTVYHNDLSSFPQDGKVCRYNNYKYYYSLGHTSNHPRGAIAIKTRSDGVKTKLIDVIWQTGKTGKVTPVAILEPVEIEGAIVQKATLNNPGFIEALGVEIGDYVMIERAGAIIPRIIKKAE